MTFACICIAAKDPTLFFFMILFLVFRGRQNTGQSLEEAADGKGKPQAGPGRPAGAAAASQPPRLPREPLPPALGSDTHARPRSPMSSSRRHPGRWPGRTSSESAPRCESLGAPALPAAHLPGCPAEPPGLPSPAPSPGDTPVAQKPEAFVHVAQVLGCRSAWTGRCGTGRCWEDLPRSLQKTGRCRPPQTLHAAEPVWVYSMGPCRAVLSCTWTGLPGVPREASGPRYRQDLQPRLCLLSLGALDSIGRFPGLAPSPSHSPAACRRDTADCSRVVWIALVPLWAPGSRSERLKAAGCFRDQGPGHCFRLLRPTLNGGAAHQALHSPGATRTGQRPPAPYPDPAYRALRPLCGGQGLLLWLGKLP
ncbi:uncharacterized protein LOC116543540 [Sapajus apella]|uniref:Uncharacterized protein LOC116543540 n=1 Tax=Sapajus apella TaxID=9515 RepID=A0A6J3H3G2_SAPAP|nr:uncharacterized protein LOC116543540 [Sapajus apella]